MTRGRVPSDDRQYRVFPVELDDDFGPRRRPDRPNIYLGTTTRSRFHADLTRNYGPATRAESQRQKRSPATKLMRRGFTVNRDTTVWRVYEIELDDRVGPRKHPDLALVYAGESTRTPEERFEQHKSQARNRKGPVYSRVVARHGLHLRPDLNEDDPVLYT